MIDRLRYLFYNQFSKGTKRLYLWLSIISVLPILILSVLLFIIPGASPFSNFISTFYTQLLAALDPGNLLVFDLIGESESEWSNNLFFILSSLIATLIGLMIIATLIGIISASIEEVMLSLRKGKTKVVEKNHIIILGWTDEIFSIISELKKANANVRNQAIAIMAQEDPVLMKDAIEERVDIENIRMIYRRGSPLDITDLKILAIESAKSVIILTDNQQRDIQVLKICLAINQLTPGEFEHGFTVVVGMDSPSNIDLLKKISKNSISPFNVHYLHSKIIAQCCRQSGLSVIYSDLLDFDGQEIYFLVAQELIGASFKDALTFYENSMIIGITNDNETNIQPENHYIIKKGDKLISIQEDDNVERKAENKNINLDYIKTKSSIQQSKQDILIINWNIDGSYLLKDLCQYIDDESRIDIVLDSNGDFEKEQIEREVKEISSKVGRVTIDDINSIELLESLNIEQYHSIVILSETVIPNLDMSNKADAKTIIALLQLRSIKEKLGIEIPIISQIQNPINKALTDQKSTDDFIVSHQLIGNYTCQLAENPGLQEVFDEILKPEGSEIYLRNVEDFINTKEPVNFYTVMEAFTLHNEIPIGYKVFEEIYDPKQHGVHLNPNKSDYINFSANDKIIVLADS